jgi:protein-disulfide isomerase-like protein with CxxC motif
LIEVTEYTDPGCSWAWGAEPKRRLLQWRFGDVLRFRRVMGGLVGDMSNYLPDFDREEAAATFVSYWRRVGSTTGMPHPAGLRWMYRSTEPSCRAVKAAERQGDEVAERVLRRLCEATFVHGEPPDDEAPIAAAVAGVPGLDTERLVRDLGSPEIEAAFRADWEETRQPNDQVLHDEPETEGGGRAKHTEGHWRYVFPTWLLRAGDAEVTVAGWKPLERYLDAMEELVPGCTREPRPDPTPAEVLERWGTAAGAELDLLCGGRVPAGAVAHDGGGGVLWLSPREAAARDLGTVGPA